MCIMSNVGQVCMYWTFVNRMRNYTEIITTDLFNGDEQNTNGNNNNTDYVLLMMGAGDTRNM